MINLVYRQKRFIVGSAVATAAMFQTGTEAESLIDSSGNTKKAQLAALSFNKSEARALKVERTKSDQLIVLRFSDSEKDSSEEMETTTVWPQDTVLSQGDNGRKVKDLQQVLHDLGYYVATLDGKYGPKTEKAVAHYQQKHGLKIDGIAGNETLRHLIGVKTIVKQDVMIHPAANPDVSSVYLTAHRDSGNHGPAVYAPPSEEAEQERSYLMYGDRDEDVTALQEKLKRAGYYSAGTDGIFGSYTQQAVRSLQRNHNLTVDGLAGEEVISFLEEQNFNHNVQTNQSASADDSNQDSSENSENQTDEEAEDNSAASDAEEKNSSRQTQSAVPSSQNIISAAKNLTGSPYQWGGTTPSGFDCSGFLNYVFQKNGTDLPRSVSDIWDYASSVSSAQPGDLVFFQTYKKGPSHAGIYLGQGRFIHSGSSTGVAVAELSSPYWSSRYLGARRVTN